MNPVTELTSRLEKAFSPSGPAETGATSQDPLAEALRDIARHYGISVDAASVTAGLPLTGGLLPLEHIETAAERAGLEARMERTKLDRLLSHELPLLIIPKGAPPKILWSIDGEQNVTVSSGAGVRQIASLASLAGRRKVTIVRLSPAGNAAVDDLGLPTTEQNWLLAGFKGSAPVLAEAIAATLAINVLALALPLYTMNVLDRVVPNAAIDTLWALSLGVLLAAAFDFIIKMLRSHAVDAVSRRADVRLANMIFGRLLGARLQDKAASTGARANTLREFESLREFLNSVTLTTLGDMPFLVLFVIVLAIVAGPLSLVVVAAIPLLLGAALVVERALTRASRDGFKNAAQKSSVAVEALAGLETIKASGAESWAASRWERAVVEHVRNGLVIRHWSTLGMNVIGSSTIVVQVAIVVIGCHMVAAGELTSGALVAATMLASRALAPLNQLAMLVTRMHQARLAWQTLTQIVRSPQEKPAGAVLIANRRITGRLELESVAYRYEKDAAAALDAVSFSIAPGERVGIIGGIGSGKSTLLKLAVALHEPSSGRVLVDGAAASQYDPHALRRQVGICLQGADLFEGTVRSNIALADLASPEDAILDAARISGALDWIARLPRGLDTPVRERGIGLSRGQRQQVALARALLRRPQMLLLDEPTSDMDIFTESQVVRRLADATRGRTLIVVTHRPAPLEIVDRLIVLEAGRKIADGPKADVMRALRDSAGRATGNKQEGRPVAPIPAKTILAERQA